MIIKLGELNFSKISVSSRKNNGKRLRSHKCSNRTQGSPFFKKTTGEKASALQDDTYDDEKSVFRYLGQYLCHRT